MRFTRLASIRPTLGSAARSPLTWILAMVFAVEVAGIGWGLPASDGWDNDGVAPRDFLAGLVETVQPGHFTTYPPVHLVLLALLTAPITLVALAHAHSFAAPDVIEEILRVRYMTPIAYASRLVSVAMSLGTVWAAAKIAEELRGPRAGWCAAALVGVNVPLTYYAHTSNLDVPYLFWGSLALLALVRAVARREPRRLRRWGVLAALAVGTKDQAYALFLLGVPATLGSWIGLDPWARSNVRALLRHASQAIAIAVGLLAVIDGAIFNPSGLLGRVRFLMGPASQTYAQYTDDWVGRGYVLRDVVSHFDRYYPLAFAPIVVFGLWLVVRESGRGRTLLVAGLAPLFAAVSFSVAFNCVARRTDHRFLLPQSLMAGIYGGLALQALLWTRLALARWVARVYAGGAFATGLFGAADVDANLVLDPRYDAEAWLRAHAGPGDTIETYGLNVYMPRFAPGVSVTRVSPDAAEHRSPMPGIRELVDAYGSAQARGARFLVVSQGWAWRYLKDPDERQTEGRMLPPTQLEMATRREASDYFKSLTRDAYGSYRLAHAAQWQSAWWPPVDIHASTAREIWIYER
jgi:hypothetical protein